MMVQIPALLSADEVGQCRQALARAQWVDGRTTAGHQAGRAKQNLQLAAEDPIGHKLSEGIVTVLAHNPRFMAAALLLKVFPPRFNRYEGGGTYGQHVDSAVLSVPGSPHRIRSDISATLFLSDPDEYDGGALTIEDAFGAHSVKLPAGDLVIYPGTSLHCVTPVTRGTRFAAFFWVQSLVRDDSQRSLLWELDQAIQALDRDDGAHPELPRLLGVYQNLLRRWSQL